LERLREVLGEAQRRGFLGSALIDEHIEHARGFVAALEGHTLEGATVLDLGSGGGVPGLVVAEDVSDARLVLLDGSVVRAAFLRWAVDYLGLNGRVTVVAARAEEIGRAVATRSTIDVVLARGFAGPGVTAECAAPLLRVGGRLVVSDPPGGGAIGERWPVDGCRQVGLVPESHVSVPRSYTVLRQAELCPAQYPRRVGVPTKRPLF
jgi:16S rRNA (guanine527-N7)-methyltransferase